MRKVWLSWRGLEVESLRWRGAHEFGLMILNGRLLWTWRHRQGVFF